MNEKLILIKDGYVQNPGEKEQKKNVLIKNGKIISLVDYIPSGVEIVYANGCYVTPGLIDQHLHGGYGCNFNSSSAKSIINFLLQLPKHGITSICPTIMTDSPQNIVAQIKEIKEAKANLPLGAAKISGINLEGPFINPKYRGAHQEALCMELSPDNYKQFEDDEVRIVTVAPELDKDFALTKYLALENVVVSAGHSLADRETVLNAMKAGLKQVTHIFNAMAPMHHRKPGIVGCSLINDTLYTEVIADHNHLHSDILELIHRTKPVDKIIYVSDSLLLNQSEQDWAFFGGQKIFKRGEIAVNEEGNFAGSLLFLDSILKKNLKTRDFPQLLMYCASNPALNLGLDDLGCIKEGNSADLVFWDKETFEIKQTFVNGCPCL